MKLTREQLAAALQEHRLSRKPKKDALEIWRPIAETLHKFYSSDPRKFLESCAWDATKIIEEVRIRKQGFPYLSGSKILPLWLRMLNDEAGVSMT